MILTMKHRVVHGSIKLTKSTPDKYARHENSSRYYSATGHTSEGIPN